MLVSLLRQNLPNSVKAKYRTLAKRDTVIGVPLKDNALPLYSGKASYLYPIYANAEPMLLNFSRKKLSSPYYLLEL